MFTNETFKAANLTKFYNVILSHTDYNNYNL